MKEKFKAHLTTLHSYRGLAKELVSRDLKTKYRRSFLGYLWSLLNPLLMMLVIATVFSRVLDIRIENFTIYLLTGQVIFNFFSESTTFAMGSIINNGPLIRKVYVPKYLFPASKVLSSFVGLVFSLLAVVIMLIITQTPITWAILLFPLPLLYILVFSMGVGLLLSAITVFFRDIMHLYSVVLQAWMYATPIIYPVEMLGSLAPLMKYNPMFHYVECFRSIVMYGTLPSLERNLFCIGFSLLMLVIGIVVFYRKQDRFILFT
ncbi:MAG: ABC transporter permease [Christensenellales bacterium]|jgi:ABC-2 type transport system permease protein